MAHRITVTQLKCAVLDPAWRERWLAGEKPSTMVFSPSGAGTSSESGNGITFGTKFHQETDRLAKWLTSPGQLATAAAIDSSDDILQFLWRSSLQDFTDKLLSKGKGPAAIALTERMRSYCKRLIDLKKRTVNFENWQDVFVFTEEDITGIRLPVGGNNVEIAGRVDAIRFHPPKRAGGRRLQAQSGHRKNPIWSNCRSMRTYCRCAGRDANSAGPWSTTCPSSWM
jgi:hypothetical protein